jgi:hypothetical protein
MADKHFTENEELAFKQNVIESIEKRVREKISQALVEIMSSHDLFIASSLEIDVYALMRHTALAEIEVTLKEG